MGKYPNIPTVPPDHPIWRNGLSFSKKPLSFIDKYNKIYGDTYRVSFGISDLLLINNIDDIQHVLQKNHRNYEKSKGYKILRKTLGNGLLTSEGEYWKKNRRIVQPAFYKESLANLAQAMHDTTKEMMATWNKRIANGEQFILLEETMTLTCDIVTKCLFSSDVSGKTKAIRKAVSVILDAAMPLMTNPLMVPHWIPTKFNRELRAAMKVIDDVLHNIINKRRKHKEAVHKDLLDMLMYTYDEETGDRMTNQQLRDEIIIMFLAGHETSANALAFTFYLLENNPDEKEKFLEEIEHAFTNNELDLSKIGSLTYTKQIINESLRLYPPAWIIGRRSLEEDQLSQNKIDQKQNLLFCPYFIHRDERYWENPELFNPERFSKESERKMHNFQFFPFGGGPRLCVGNNFAYMEMTIILAILYKNYNFFILNKGLELLPRLTLRPKGGIPIKVEMKKNRIF